MNEPKLRIENWGKSDVQMALLGKCSWSVPRLIELSKDLPVMEIPIDHLNIYYTYDKLSLRELVMHFNAIMDQDMSYPIILDEDGELMDGRHRIMRALFERAKTIKAVRFVKNPSPCKHSDD